MGNKAVITASTSQIEGIGIYLHWNGSLPTVLAFLDTAKLLGYRSPSSDESYGMARLCGLICAFLGIDNERGIGIGELSRLDCNNYDNGVYVIGNDWEIIDRWGEGSTNESIDDARKSEQYIETMDYIKSKLVAWNISSAVWNPSK